MATATFDIFKIGSEVYAQGERLDITPEFADEIVSNFNRLKKDGNVVPVLIEHERNGIMHGIVEAVYIFSGYVQAELAFKNQALVDAFNNGQIDFDSPGFALEFTHPHTGEEFGPTLFEVSITSLPRQINLRPATSLNPGLVLAFNESIPIITISNGVKMDDVTTQLADDVVVEEEEEKEEFSTEAAFTKLFAMLGEMMGEKPQPALSEDSKVVKLNERIEVLEAQVIQAENERTIAELAAAGITEDVEDLVELKRANAKLFSKTIKRLSDVAVVSGPMVQTPIGTTGTESIEDHNEIAEIEYSLKSNEVPRGAETIQFIDDHFGQDRRNAYLQHKNGVN